MTEKVRENVTSLERRLERMREGEEGETCQALAWEENKDAEENNKEVEIPSKTKEVVELQENRKTLKSEIAKRARKN